MNGRHSLCDEVRRSCAAIAASARLVRIDEARIAGLDPGPPPGLDPEVHFLEGPREDVADYLLTLDAINFGSGWFPTIQKEPGLSGYNTVATRLSRRFRAHGPWSAADLRAGVPIADVLGQDPGHELMALYADALRELGEFLGERRAVDLIGNSAEALAEELVAGMPLFDDRGFWKRAQITANDLHIAGIADFADIDRLTIFADNLVPHVLRVDGVLVYEPRLAGHIDSGELLPRGEEEREIRACAVHACELIAAATGMPARDVDVALWNRGQAARYKLLPRHRTRTVFY